MYQVFFFATTLGFTSNLLFAQSSGEVAAAVGGGVLLGPQADTQTQFLFEKYYDLNNDQKYQPGEPLREFRLDVKAFTKWSNMDYANVDVHPSILSGIFDNFDTWDVNNDVSGDLQRVSKRTSNQAITRLLIEDESDLVPVIILSTDPAPVIQALRRVTKATIDNKRLQQLLGLKKQLENVRDAQEEEKKKLGSVGAVEASLSANIVTLSNGINQTLDSFKTTAPLSPKTDSKLGKALANLENATKAGSGLSADEKKLANEMVGSEYKELKVHLLTMLGEKNADTFDDEAMAAKVIEHLKPLE
jgi:hypothetical protein